MASVSAVVDALEDLGAIREVQRTMTRLDLRSGTGWKAIRAALEEAWSPDVERDLVNLYLDLRESSRKSVFLYRIKDRNLLARLSAAVAPEEKSRFKSYPLPDKNTSATLDVRPVLVGKSVRTDGLFLTFCSNREQTIEEEIPDSYLKDSAPPELRGAKKFAVRRQWLQAYDLIVVRRNLVVELRIDKFDGRRTVPSAEEAAVNIRRWLIDRHIAVTADDLFSKPINLFPAIRSIYDANDGRLFNADHDDSESGRRTERVRDRKKDIRGNRFHAGGVKEAGPVNLYRIDVEWDTDVAGNELHNARLALPGGPRNLLEARLMRAEVPKVCNAAAFDFVVGRLLHHAGA